MPDLSSMSWAVWKFHTFPGISCTRHRNSRDMTFIRQEFTGKNKKTENNSTSLRISLQASSSWHQKQVVFKVEQVLPQVSNSWFIPESDSWEAGMVRGEQQWMDKYYLEEIWILQLSSPK